MDVAEVLERCGGVTTRAVVVQAAGRAAFDASVRSGRLVRVAHGAYASALSVSEARTAAVGLRGVVSHLDAALHWGWAVKTTPTEPHVTLPPNRRVDPARARGVVLHRADLGPDDVVDGVTSRERTVIDCLRSAPEDEALAVADSALRTGESSAWLTRVLSEARGPGVRRARAVAAAASPAAANPFESTLRWQANQVSGLHVRPQVDVYGRSGWLARPDLVDEELGIVLEADSFEWHGQRAGLVRDARRYNALAVEGWLVLRFTWEDVMHEPALVDRIMRAAVEERSHWPRLLGRHA